jgi:hypothetical protein
MEQIRYSFLVKKNKQRSDGKIPLYLRITMGKETRDIFLKMHITHKDWNDAKQNDGTTVAEAKSTRWYTRRIKFGAFAISANAEVTDQIIKATIIKATTSGSFLHSKDIDVVVTQSNFPRRSLPTAEIEAKIIDVTLNNGFKGNSTPSN